MYAFVAKNDVQAKALEKSGAVWMPSMGVWIGRDLSSWKLRRLKKKGLVPKATGFPMETTKTPLKWPQWIKIITLGPPVAMFSFLGFHTVLDNFLFEGVIGTILITLITFFFSFAFIGQFAKLAYAFYRRLRGDRSYWEDMTTNTAPRMINKENTIGQDNDLVFNPAYSSFSGNIYHRNH